MYIEIAPGEELKEGLSVKIDFLKFFVFLIINVGISESMLGNKNTLWRQ